MSQIFEIRFIENKFVSVAAFYLFEEETAIVSLFLCYNHLLNLNRDIIFLFDEILTPKCYMWNLKNLKGMGVILGQGKPNYFLCLSQTTVWA